MGQVIELVRDRNFEDAVHYLRNNSYANKVGLSIEPTRMEFQIYGDMSQEDVNTKVYSVAYFSKFTPLPEKRGILEFANVFILPQEFTGKSLPVVPENVLEEITFIYLEHWLYALRYIKGKTLTGEQSADKDIANYLKSKKLTLPSIFAALHE